jgi:hypothetical protein
MQGGMGLTAPPPPDNPGTIAELRGQQLDNFNIFGFRVNPPDRTEMLVPITS